MPAEEPLLERLRAVDASSLIVAAHPDDEVIGLGGQFHKLKNLRVVHVTDGSPRALGDANANGFSTREDYARARRLELAAALALAGIPPERACELGFVDQEASLHLVELSCRLNNLFAELRPEIVLAHPYEGGHPDHDAAAFSVHAACRMLRRQRVRPPEIIEFTSYHARNGSFEVMEFLEAAEPIETIHLAQPVRALKRRMIECFITQRGVLEAFPVELERLRPAPEYDFTRPPHPGRLHYENHEWGMTGERWRALASQALNQLQL